MRSRTSSNDTEYALSKLLVFSFERYVVLSALDGGVLLPELKCLLIHAPDFLRTLWETVHTGGKCEVIRTL